MQTEPAAQQVVDEVLAVSARLHDAIAHFDEASGHYALGGVPGVAYFERDHPDRITHESNAPSPMVAAQLDELAQRHLARVGAPEGAVNSHVHALLLLVLTMLNEDAQQRFRFDQHGKRPAQIVALDEEDGRHDPELEVGDAALRAWVPIASDLHPGAGAQPTILEFRFFNQRYQKYVPAT
jgi:hypothetical protein